MDADDRRLGPAGTAIGVVLAIMIGLFTGTVTTFVHRQWAHPIPWGLIIGLAVIACVIAGFRLVFDSRVIAAAAAVGVLGALSILALQGPGGSALVIDDDLGWTWVIGPTVIAAIVLAWPRIRRPESRAPVA